ncbi:MAG: dephospho-CoA kinase [Nocardioidaceae bacterium]|nr:dephospho-CoA kinase [Nocardioidaceae bacterium]
MLRVGLTGGIASGKSTVSALLRERGAVVIDADVLAREVVAPGTPGLSEVVEAFGPGVMAADGTLDRPALAARVFRDERARRRLEAIIHPRVRARAADLEAAAPEDAVVVHDIPLLVEAGQAASFDVVVVVDAPPERQLARLVAERRLSPEEARSRIEAQVDRDTRSAAATFVVPNNASRADLADAVDVLWQQLQHHRHPPGSSAGVGGDTG